MNYITNNQNYKLLMRKSKILIKTLIIKKNRDFKQRIKLINLIKNTLISKIK